MGVDGDRLETISKIRSEHAQSETRYTKSRRERREKKLMVNGVKGCREVQKYKGGGILNFCSFLILSFLPIINFFIMCE